MSKPLKRLSPLSIRLSEPERAELEARADGQSLSSYVKWALFDAAPDSKQSGPLADANRKLLAHLLATLGASHVAPNLDRLAHEAEIGNLFADRVTIRRLREACDDVRLMHNALMRGLGLKEGPPGRNQQKAVEAFARAAKSGGES